MRSRLAVLSALLGIALIGSLVAGPAQAAEGEFEGTIIGPQPVVDQSDFAEMACGDPNGGDLNGINYAWVDLEADYKNFEFDGPADLFREPDPTGAIGGPFGDHDLDYYLYDAKCKDVTTHTNLGESKVKAEARRPARYVLVLYWAGIHPEVSYTIVASN